MVKHAGRLSLLGGPPVLLGLVPTRAARAPRTQACVPSSNSAPCLVRSNQHRDSGAPRTEPSTRTTQGRVPEGVRSFKHTVCRGRRSRGPASCPCGERRGSKGTRDQSSQRSGLETRRRGMAGGGKDNVAELR